MSQNNGSSTSLRLKTGLAEMLKGGVIMDVTTAEQAAIAEKAGAVAVMALERVPAQIRAEGGVARMASPKKIREIMATVSIPVMAKCRIGHFGRSHAGNAAFGADLRGHALEGHDGDGSGFFGDGGLLGGGDVHDDAAFKHFGEAGLEAEAGGATVGRFSVVLGHVWIPWVPFRKREGLARSAVNTLFYNGDGTIDGISAVPPNMSAAG